MLKDKETFTSQILTYFGGGCWALACCCVIGIFIAELLFTPKELTPVCGTIPGVGIIAGVEEIAVGPRVLITFWFATIPPCPNCEPDTKPPCATDCTDWPMPMLLWLLVKEDDTAIVELPVTVGVFEPNEPRAVLCTICWVLIGCPGPDIEEMTEGVDVMPLDIMFDMWTCIGVAPMLGSPIEVAPPPKEVEFINRTCDRLLRRLPWPPGRIGCWTGFIIGLCSCTLSFPIFASCEIREGDEVCSADIPCEATFEIGVTCEKAGAETIGGMVVGSYKNKNCKGIIIRMEKKNRQIPRIVQLTTLTDVVEIPPTIGWRPAIAFTRNVQMELVIMST
jgi:hypothetical protein